MLEFCLLCGSPSYIQGVFVPYDSAAWKIPREWEFHYGLCKKCCNKMEAEELVENYIAHKQGIRSLARENN